ncbi:hypothetical protein SAMN06297144_0642 [Sphingomonas guangdongensis]|uniref:Uncharacterized protein n=1 Tax=Sphingomonas guangdongensis TaxID=1141890 RepID=A0A285QCS7_9SPHN|nr:hypothetical protein [Sphingomonas guangdongensis]SOB79611.1 hypothetical protein SAMN06297144_0642 [Sphingomonas guangdongensis]
MITAGLGRSLPIWFYAAVIVSVSFGAFGTWLTLAVFFAFANGPTGDTLAQAAPFAVVPLLVALMWNGAAWWLARGRFPRLGGSMAVIGTVPVVAFLGWVLWP